jgi:drug/metabolite transporter (DMT)-like permease
MPDADMEISWQDYLQAVAPIAIFNTCGLALGNLAVEIASIAFLQMIKPANLIWGSVVAFIFGVEPPTPTHVIIVAVVVSGVTLASHGNAEFNLHGFLFQILATAAEGTKLVLIQRVTSKRLKLDPLTTVYKYAPLAFVCLGLLSLVSEGSAILEGLSRSKGLVAMNCGAAVILNVLIVGAIGHTSAVVFILAGLMKDIGTIIASVTIFGSIVGLNQVLGFALSLLGILMYKAYKQHLDIFLARGFLGGFSATFGFEAAAAADGKHSNGTSSSNRPVAEERQAMGKAGDDEDGDQLPELGGDRRDLGM